MALNKALSIAYYIGMALVFIGVLMGVTDTPNDFWVLGAGTLPIIGVRTYNVIVGRPQNKRIFSILLVSSMFLAAATWALYTNRSFWIVLVFITAVLDSYASWRRVKR